MRVLYWVNMAFAEHEIIEALAALPVKFEVARSFPEVLHMLPEADMLISADCTAEYAVPLCAALRHSRVKYYQILSAGRDGLISAGVPETIELFGPRDDLAPAVAEHAMALALALYRGLPSALRHPKWDRSLAGSLRCMEGDTALIIGLGAIGRDVARRVRVFGAARILAATRRPNANPDCDEVVSLSSLHRILPEAGVVFLTLALTSETRGIFGAECFEAMRKGAFLVNVARGALVDQSALHHALVSGWLGGAGLDVADPEPLPETDPLWQAPNLIITPHIAAIGSTISQQRLAATVSANIGRIL